MNNMAAQKLIDAELTWRQVQLLLALITPVGMSKVNGSLTKKQVKEIYSKCIAEMNKKYNYVDDARVSNMPTGHRIVCKNILREVL